MAETGRKVFGTGFLRSWNSLNAAVFSNGCHRHKCRKFVQSNHNPDALPAIRHLSTGTDFPWDLSSSMCIERMAKLVPELTPFQRKLRDTLSEMEVENSLKGDHELRREKDRLHLERVARGELSEKEAILHLAHDDEDTWKKELREFCPASRTTSGDAGGGDRRTAERALDRPLGLLVQRRRLGDERLCWDMPVARCRAGETMRQAAERAVQQECGTELRLQVLGNAPWAVYKYKYPKQVQEKLGKKGMKVFVFRAHLMSGNVNAQDATTVDYAWVEKSDFLDTLDDTASKAVKEIIFEES